MAEHELYNAPYSGTQIDAGIDGGLHALRIDGQNIITVAQATTLLRQLYAVGYAPQTLTPAQKAQARRNIGAGEGTGDVIASATEPTDPSVSVWISTSGDTPVLYIKNTAGVWYPVPGLVGPPGPAAGVNPNLLDNWYFGNPVNQRAQSEYTATVDATYTIDRWRTNGAKGTVNVDTNGLTISATGTARLYLRQILETPVEGACIGSLIVDAIEGTIIMQARYDDGTFSTAVSSSSPGLLSCRTSPTKKVDQLLVGINAGTAVTLRAAKLELGDIQTLAHQNTDGNWVLNDLPNYGEQLERCQRFCFVHEVTSNYLLPFASGFIGSAGGLRVNLFTPVAMRTVPGITNTDGIEYLAMYGNKYVSLGTEGLSVFNVKQNNLNLLINLTEYTAYANATLALRGAANTTKRLIFSADL